MALSETWNIHEMREYLEAKSIFSFYSSKTFTGNKIARLILISAENKNLHTFYESNKSFISRWSALLSDFILDKARFRKINKCNEAITHYQL